MSRKCFSLLPKCEICSNKLSSFEVTCSAYFSFSVSHDNTLICLSCSKLFPFQDLDDDEFLVLNSFPDLNLSLASIYNECQNYNFKPFNYTEFANSDFHRDIDPENNFFNRINLECEYYTESQINHTITNKQGLSIIHFNCRSINANFEKIEEFLQNIDHTFDVIALTETWLNENSLVPELVGFKCCHQPRLNKKGGGVAMYINNQLNFKILDTCTTSVNDTLECLSIEIVFDNSKNIVISCIYRQPGSCVESCIDLLNSFFSTLSKKKLVYLCGDFNINLLNIDLHRGTRDFLDFLYSLGIYPLIDKPSRIALGSATLIDNIFTNDIHNYHFSGLLINDITDHLPVFTIRDCNFDRRNFTKFVFVRNNDVDALQSFCNELKCTDWSSLLNNQNVNECYNSFLNHFIKLYDEHCPIKKIKVTSKKEFKPWFT